MRRQHLLAGARGQRPQRPRSLAIAAALAAFGLTAATVSPASADTAGGADEVLPPARASVAVIDDFPRDPGPWKDFDWAQRSRDYDAFLYDWTDRGPFTTITEDPAPLNMPAGSKSFRIPAYYGDTRVSRAEGQQESVAQISSVVGATLVGIDKSDQDGHDYVDMLRTFFHPDLGVALNTPDGSDSAPGSQSMWYTTTANVLYAMLGAQYPDATDMESIQRSIADKYYAMLVQLGGPAADLTMQDYDFAQMVPKAGIRNEGGDVAAGTAAILLWAHERFDDQKYLDGAVWAMDYLERSKNSLYYELLAMLAPYVAARLNAEAGTEYDVVQMFSQIRLGMERNVRPNWGIMGAQWDGHDVQGLSGSRTDLQGYAFAMNSFATPWLAATAKYDTRFADTVGLWMLNLYNAGRFFYADQMPASQLEDGDRFIGDPAHVIAYEGLRHRGPGHDTLVASSDVFDRSGGWGLNPETTNLGIYGASWVGWMGGTVRQTNVEKVLRTDLNALDMYADSYPTSLYYNPGTEDALVDVAVDGTRDLYDSARDRLLASGASGTAQVSIPAGSSVVLVQLPAGADRDSIGHEVVADGVGVRWDTDPQRDLALGASASASTGDAGAATDGDAETTWASSRADAQSLTVDLGSVRRVSEATLTWAAHPTGTVLVESSADRQSWSALGTASAPADGAFADAARDARWVRVSITGGGAGTQRLQSVEVRQRDLALGAAATVSSTANALNVAAHVTDGSDFTRWESATSDPQWVQLDLGRVTALGSARIEWEAAAAKAYRIEVSDDGATWRTAYQTTTADGGVDEIALTEGTEGRYLRLTGTQRLTQWSYSLYSLEAYAPASVPTTRTTEPALHVDATEVRAGGTVTVSGTGFDGEDRVRIELHSTPVEIGAADVDASGRFETQVVVPKDAATGSHELVAVGVATGQEARVALRVTAADPEPGGSGGTDGTGNGGAESSAAANGGPGSLASTGGDGVAGGIVAGVLALLAGAVLIAARRLRPSAENEPR
ncbi:discoidin domain-containing protein [Microbacterium sp. CIAB417]|uniref:discoidin domain-containing protein n=1 Tax=Microbacterium sp. CIAB417 TaxID=2860287 RepID=UPI001FADB76A|nr:discoidin domain-containing protein [Microbacterium sp. CIAB417]